MRSLAVLAAALIGCSSSSGNPGRLSVFTDWIQVESTCADYVFRAPPEIVAEEITGFDYCVERWRTRQCEYVGDYSSFASDLSAYRRAPEYQERQEAISGRDAKLITAVLADTGPRYTAAITIAEVDPAQPGSRLTIDVRCETSAAQLDALSVLRTLELRE